MDSFRMPTFQDVLSFVPLYDNLPYHNFGHAGSVYSRVLAICDQIILEGGKVNKSVAAWAALGHDTNIAKPLGTGAELTKEERSGNDTFTLLKKLGASDEFCQLVKETIIDGTLKEGRFRTVEAQVVRAADLATIGGEYPEFYASNINVYLEVCQLSGKQIPFHDWKNSMIQMFTFYTAQDIHLTSKYFDKDGHSRWHENAHRNLGRFMLES